MNINLPVIPNTPLPSPDAEMGLAPFALERNRRNGLVENRLFDPEHITYDASYQNNQSMSGIFLNHMQDMYRIIHNRYGAGSKLVEVGCGKGHFLDIVKAADHFGYAGYDATYEGDDPNIHARYIEEDDRIAADIVVLRHTLEHIRRPEAFLALMHKVFGNADIFIEVPDFGWIERNRVLFDFSYEHVNYFSRDALASLFTVSHAHQPAFGGQYQYVLAPLGALRADFGVEAGQPENWEEYSLAPFFMAFREQVKSLGLQSSGSVWIWGGATKGVLFLHHLKDLIPELFERVSGVVDVNPGKQHRYTASTGMRILPPEDFAKRAGAGDSVIVMNRNYLAEIEAYVLEHGAPSITVSSL